MTAYRGMFGMVKNDWPLLLYIYDNDGFHNGSECIQNVAELDSARERIVDAIAAKREVIITDMMDLTVFHAKDGKLIYPNSVVEDQK